MARGSKKTVDALEVTFETRKKPTQQNFFDLLASFYHKDEDIAFLISLSKATQTDAQAGEDNSRYMTAIRVKQAIDFWVRLNNLENLLIDVDSLIGRRINEMWQQLLATNDQDLIINTLGEVFQVLQGFPEQVQGLKNRFDNFDKILRDVPDVERSVMNIFDNHNGRIGVNENRLAGVPNNTGQVQNTFNYHESRIGVNENRLSDVPNNTRQVQNTFDNLNGRVGTNENRLAGVPNNTGQVQNNLNNHESRIGTNENKLSDVPNNTRQVQNTFDNHSLRINDAQTSAYVAANIALDVKGDVTILQIQCENVPTNPRGWINSSINDLYYKSQWANTPGKPGILGVGNGGSFIAATNPSNQSWASGSYGITDIYVRNFRTFTNYLETSPGVGFYEISAFETQFAYNLYAAT